MPSVDDVPISQVIQMRERNLSNSQIIQVLQQQGYNPQQIYDALAQAEARQSVESYSGASDVPNEVIPPNAPLSQSSVNSSFAQNPAHFQQDFSGSSSHSNEEIIESIIDEKWQKLLKDNAKLSEWKDSLNNRMERVEQQVIDLKSNLDGIHKAIIAKVGEYDKNLTDVGTEIKAMERVFKDILPEMTNNIQELSKLTSDLKGNKKPAKNCIKNVWR